MACRVKPYILEEVVFASSDTIVRVIDCGGQPINKPRWIEYVSGVRVISVRIEQN